MQKKYTSALHGYNGLENCFVLERGAKTIQTVHKQQKNKNISVKYLGDIFWQVVG